MSDEDRRIGIDWSATVAGALAAVTVAVLLSTLGAAGTLLGAALGSVIATVSTALYKQGIASSRRKMSQVQSVALSKVGMAQDDVRNAARSADPADAAAKLAKADRRLEEVRGDLAADSDDDPATHAREIDLTGAIGAAGAAGTTGVTGAAGTEPEEPEEPEVADLSLRERLALLPWKRIAVAAAGIFLVALMAITAFELVAGRSVSSFTGGSDSDSGTSISDVRNRGDRDRGNDDDRNQQPNDDSTTEPTDGATTPEATEPTSSAPTSEATESAEPTTEPTSEATSESPTESPSPAATGGVEDGGADAESAAPTPTATQ